MNKILFTILFVLLLCVSTLASSITVNPITVSSWRYPMVQGIKVRIYPNNTFLTSDGSLVKRGQVGVSQWYKEYSCTVSGTNVTLPTMTLDSTTDSDVPSASYTAIFFDSKGNKIDTYYNAFRVPSTYGSTVTWNDIRAYTESVSITLPSGYYPVTTTDSRLEKDLSLYSNSLTTAIAALGVSDTTLGCTRAVTVSVDTTIPKNLKLRPSSECLITVAAGKTLTINAMVEDPVNWRIFNTTAAGASVRFGKGAVHRMNINWWTGSATGAAVDATDAISEALASTTANAGGTIYFPEGNYTTTGGHQGADNVIVEGDSNFVSYGYGGTNLKLVSPTTTYMFKIGEGEFGIRFKNILLDGTGTTGKDAILLQGAYPNTSGDLKFTNVTIQNFAIGLHYNSTSGSWQFAQIGFDSCIFQTNTVAVSANSLNSQLTFENTNFAVPASGKAFDMAGGGLLTVKGSEFAGGGSTSKVIVISGAHVQYDFIGVQDENFGTFLQNDASDVSGITNIIGSLIQSKIQLNQTCTLNSFGNNYLSKAFVFGVGATPFVTSRGDHIRGVDVADGVTVVSPPRLASDVTKQDNIVIEENGINTELRYRQPVKVISPLIYDSTSTIPFSVGIYQPSGVDKPAIRFGRLDINGAFDYYYDITREYSTGRAIFSGNQTGFVGYEFRNGDVYVSGAIRGQSYQLTDAATITLDPKAGNHQYVTLGGNRTLAMLALGAAEKTRSDGMRLTIEIIQDATGTRTCSLSTGSAGQFVFGTDIASITCTVTANKRDLLTVVYSARMDRWMVVDFKKGF